MSERAPLIFSLLDTPAFGGAEQYMFSSLTYLNKNGYRIVLATNNKIVEKEILSRLTPEEKKTFSIIRAPYRLDAIGNWKGLVKFFIGLPSALVWCYRILKKLSKKSPNVICLWPGFSDRLVFSPLARFLNLPTLWIEIGPLEPSFRKNFGFPKFLYRFSERFATHVLTTSLFTKKSILKNTHFKDGDISLVYPGTKLLKQSDIMKYKKEGELWREKNYLQNMDIFIVVARLADENEVDMVLRAYDTYQKKAKRASRLLIVGDGPAREKLEKEVTTLGIKESVLFLGFVSEEVKRMALAASDVFIFPRAWELDGFGMTTIEALSLGIPVLTSNFGPQIEIITDGVEGFRYSPHDHHDLARQMEHIMKLPDQSRINMSENGLIRINDFSEDKSHEALLRVIRSVTIRK